MKNDFEMILWKFPNGQDITVWPVSDMHVGAIQFMYKKWKEFKKLILSDPNCYMVIGGDMMNNATRGSVGTGIFEDRMRPSEQKRWLAEELAPLKDRILCMVPGNHEGRSKKDTDDCPLYDVACTLGIDDRYRENMAFVKLQFGNRSMPGCKRPAYMIGVVHGVGGGGTTGASVNRNERFGMVMDGLDALVAGHSHKGALTKPEKLVIDPKNNRVSLKQFVTVGTTSWVEYGGYALRGMMTPASNDPQTMVLRGNEKKIQLIW